MTDGRSGTGDPGWEPERLTLTVDEATGLLCISRNLAYELVAEGRIPSIRLGRRVLVPRQALYRMLDHAAPAD